MNECLFYSASASFEAARRVSLLPEGHRSRKLHGHSFLANVRCELPKTWGEFPGSEIDLLTKHLRDTVAPLDYHDLNLVLEHPTDENISRWLREQLNVPGVRTFGVQSTANQGVDLDRHDNAHLWRRYRFESAHQLPNVPLGHKCGRMHGHGFEVIIHANQNLSSRDIGIDYDHLDSLWAPLHALLDHTCLNDLPGLENPTSEMLSSWIWERLKPNLDELSWVTVYETASCGAHFDGIRYRIWKEMTLDSATQLIEAPIGDFRRKVHGHTYTLRLHLHAELDQVMGWTVDFGEVKALFEPIFKRIDHHPLHEISGVKNSDIAHLLRWIRNESEPIIPQLDRIDLYQTRGNGAFLSWGALSPKDCTLPI